MRLPPVVAAALLTLGACSETLDPVAPDTNERTPKAPKVSAPESPPPEPVQITEALLYVRGSRLEAWDLIGERRIVVGELPSPDAVLSPDGRKIAVVRDLAPGTDPEGYGDPEIVVGPVGGDLSPLGSGQSPMWSPDGTQVAALTHDGVVVHDLAGKASDTVLEGERWSLVGWSRDSIAAVGPQGAALARPGTEPTFLRIPPSGLWGISPAATTVLALDDDQARFVDLSDDTSTPAKLSTALGTGAWAPDGSAVAVVEIRGSRLLLADPATGDAAEVPDGKGAQGDVVWSHDSETFAFTRVNPANRLRLQAVVCTIGTRCTEAFSWGQGVRLLGFASLPAP